MADDARVDSRAGWLHSGPFDVPLLLLGVPLAAAVVLGLAAAVDTRKMWLVFNVVFTLAHYGPTWLRAFGERDTLRQHWRKYLLFPLLFVAFVLGTRGDLQALAFVFYFWDRFHAVMQNFGVARQYGARRPRVTQFIPALDLWLLLVFALLTLSWNGGLLGALLLQLAPLGLSVSAAAITSARLVLAALAAALVLVYVVAEFRTWRATGKVNVLRTVFLVATIGGHALMNVSSDVYVLGSHEKLYHAVQYGAVTWLAFKQRRAPEQPDFAARVGRGGLVALLGFTAAWTLVIFVADQLVGPRTVANVPTAFSTLISGVALAHYYFDSFLWLRPAGGR